MKKRRRLDDVDQRVIIRALADCGGVIAEAARALIGEGVIVSRSTLSRFIAASPKMTEALKEIVEGTVDFAERKLLAQIEKDDGPSIRFMLATRGRSRGWGNSVEVTAAPPSNGMSPNWDPSRLSQDEMRLFCCLASRAEGKKDPNDDEFVTLGILPVHPSDLRPPEAQNGPRK